MPIDIDNAYTLTERLAFPRLVGTEGEKKAIKIILKEFYKAGYTPKQDKFETSFYNWNFTRYIFLILGSILILLALSFYINPLITIGIFIAGLVISYRTLIISTSARIKLSKHEEYNYGTQNIFTDLKSKKSKASIIFMAHWDSKSQTYPTSTRILIFLMFLYGSLLLFIIYLILAILYLVIRWTLPILNNILLDLCLILAAIGALNYFNKTGNLSPGAYDNAAAVGVILELARYYKSNPLEHIDLTFLSPGSEELNLGGVGVFIQKYKESFDKKTSYFINLDLIGGSDLIRLTSSYGIPKKSSSLKLNKLVLESAEELGIRIKDIYAPTGVWSDFMPIVQEGFEACWLGSEPGLKYVHTVRDDMNLVSKKGLKMILDLCTDVVKKLENEFN
jgi:hypothetical protein